VNTKYLTVTFFVEFYAAILYLLNINIIFGAWYTDIFNWQHLCLDWKTMGEFSVEFLLWLMKILLKKCRKNVWTQRKKFRLKIPCRYRKIVIKRKYFIPLWRQWPCFLKVKIRPTSYGISQAFRQFFTWNRRIYADFGMDFWL